MRLRAAAHAACSRAAPSSRVPALVLCDGLLNCFPLCSKEEKMLLEARMAFAQVRQTVSCCCLLLEALCVPCRRPAVLLPHRCCCCCPPCCLLDGTQHLLS